MSGDISDQFFGLLEVRRCVKRRAHRGKSIQKIRVRHKTNTAEFRAVSISEMELAITLSLTCGQQFAIYYVGLILEETIHAACHIDLDHNRNQYHKS